MKKLLLLQVNKASYAVPILDVQSIRKVGSNDLCDGSIREYIKDNFGQLSCVTDLRQHLVGERQGTEPYVVFISSVKNSAIVVDSVEGIVSDDESNRIEKSELLSERRSFTNVVKSGSKVIPVINLKHLLTDEITNAA